MENKQVVHIHVKKIDAGVASETSDQVAIEEPLEIQLAYSTANGYMEKTIAVTMRTPGNDEELAAGFLFTEGIIKNSLSIKNIAHRSYDANRVLVILHENILPDLKNTDRNFYSTSSCGICGKASIDAITTNSAYQNQEDDICILADLFYQLQDKLRKQQVVFENTGGIHASALFTLETAFIMMREDVGRHNALDKVVGAALINAQLPLDHCILLLSGRTSFELVQKAAMAGIKVIAAIGAPSSLAIELAKEAGITLIGFLRDGRFNLYSGYQRIGI